MKRIFIDISLPLHTGLPVWPDDPPVTIARIGEGLPAISELRLGTHTGTHVDPPAHFIAAGAAVDQLSLDALVGPAWLAHLAGPGPISAGDLAAAGIPAGTQRLLLHTINSERPGATFDPGYVALDAGAAQWLLVRGIRLVGIDAPSIEPFTADGEPAHRALLSAGVIIVEGLALGGVAPGAYELICLPLRIAGGDGAPARAILISTGA